MALEPSQTVAINSMAQEMKRAGKRVVNLSAGDPLLPPHPLIAEAAIKAIRDGKTNYPPSNGIPELREASVAWMNSVYSTAYGPEQSLITCGGKYALFAACQALLTAGDEALIVAPYWVSYPGMVKLAEAKPVLISTAEGAGWKVTVEQLEQFTNSNTRLLILNNASNPTGTLYTREELRKIIEWAAGRDIVILSDEVYSGLTYDGEFVSLGSFHDCQELILVVQSCSKHFAMTGWRVGMAFGPEKLINTLSMLQSQSTTGTSSISQWAALAAIQNAGKVGEYVRSAMLKRRDVLVGELNEILKLGITPPASALYLFLSLQKLGIGDENSVNACMRILETTGLALVPGSAFGAEGFVRLSFGSTEDVLHDAVDCLKAL